MIRRTALRRRKAAPMGVRVSERISSPSHLRFCRGFACAIEGRTPMPERGNVTTPVPHTCLGKIEAHHVTTRGAGGGDEQVVPLCSAAHSTLHTWGAGTFERRYRINLANVAADLWKASPHGQRYRNEQRQREGSGR